jgi:hypothetical protein
MNMGSLKKAVQTVAGIQQEKRIPCLLIGGFAVNEYGYSRNTLDIDFMIAAPQLPALKSEMRQSGFTQISEHANVTFFSRPDDSLRIDLLTVDENTMTRLASRSENRTLYGSPVQIPCLHDLLAMKIFALRSKPEKRKEKDLPDIAYLSVLNDLNFTTDLLPLCEQYGSPEVAEWIRSEIRRIQT